ncbi:MAG: PilZ domain-containing protein [Candidatus Eremiobacteraeota bacterium]|nr:PilZ domain-containing protein [Candidatus Eremiobacteraeota bacterium]
MSDASEATLFPAERQEPSDPSPARERRKFRRKAILVKRMVLSELAKGNGSGQRQFYLHINDISDHGMKITTDIFIPEENLIRMKLLLEPPLEIDARVVWAREIGKGNYKMGLEFLGDSGHNSVEVPHLLEWVHTYEEKKRTYSLQAPVYCEILTEGTMKKFFPYVLSISPAAMEFTCDFPFPLTDEAVFSFSVHEKLSPVTVKGKILFQKDSTPPGGPDFLKKIYRVVVEFLEPPAVEKHLMEALDRRLIPRDE